MSPSTSSTPSETLTTAVVDIEKGSASPNEDETEYPSGKKVALIMVALLLAMFLIALDKTIIATAVPQITNQFNSLDDIGWYASSYLITTCATQLIFGRLYTFYSSKVIYLASIALFEIGSVLCGAAPNSEVFIVGRALAGMGSAGLMSGNIILVAGSVPLGKRPKFMGMFGGVFGLSSILGPLLGGAFTDHLSWRWCFYINLPIGALTVLILVFILHFPPVETVPLKTQLAQLDPLGTLCFLPSIICLLLALQWGGSTYAWSSARIVVLFVISGVLFISFVAIQLWKQDNATIRPSVARNRSVYLGMFFSFFTGGAMITVIYFLPIWFQAITSVSAVASGIRTLPLVLSLVVGAFLSGGLITRFGWYNPFLFVGNVFMTIGAGLLTTLNTDSGADKWIGYQVLFGLGLGLCMQQPSLAAQAALPKEDVAIGVTLMFFCQSLGGAVMVCVSQSLFTNQLVKGLSTIAGIDPLIILRTGATELKHVVPVELVGQVLDAYNTALCRGFIAATAVVAMAILAAAGMPWVNVKGLKEGGQAVLEKREKEKREREEAGGLARE